MRVVLAHGASGNAASMRRHVDGLAARGIEASAIDLPVRKAETALDAYRTAAGLEGGAARPAVIGGHSYGGRVASLVAADGAPAVSGLVRRSCPLHRPGSREWEPRSDHWTRIGVPVLLCSGESDPFARIDLLRRAVEERLPAAELVTFPRLGHTLAPVLEEVLDRVAAFVRRT
jgi:predicted alpha/beta-hydrolase family hydrolase